MPIKHVNVKLKFSVPESGYIAAPFWGELGTVINIGKDIHPKLKPENKLKTLNAILDKMGMTMGEYEATVELSKRPFYTTDGTRAGEIVIPQRIIRSFINHVCMKAPKTIDKIPEKGITFIAITVRSIGANGGAWLTTGQTEKDAAPFTRMVKLEESNQRVLATNLYIHDFIASGQIGVEMGDPETEVITSDKLRKLIEWGSYHIGIGCARPQGFGRFQIIEWD